MALFTYFSSLFSSRRFPLVIPLSPFFRSVFACLALLAYFFSLFLWRSAGLIPVSLRHLSMSPDYLYVFRSSSCVPSSFFMLSCFVKCYYVDLDLSISLRTWAWHFSPYCCPLIVALSCLSSRYSLLTVLLQRFYSLCSPRLFFLAHLPSPFFPRRSGLLSLVSPSSSPLALLTLRSLYFSFPLLIRIISPTRSTKLDSLTSGIYLGLSPISMGSLHLAHGH